MERHKRQKLERKSLRNIPSELIKDNILPRVVSRALVRFKSVCKDWNATISSIEFTMNRLKSGHSLPQFILLHRDGKKCRFVSLSYSECANTLTDLVELECHHIDDIQGSYTIVDSCNGLVCLNLPSVDSFGIWNPVTRQYRQISYLHEIVYNNVDLSLQAEGFGYAASIDDYKIFTMFSEPFYPESASFYLFSFTSGTWKDLNLVQGTHFAQTVDNYSAVCINERLYWPHNDIQTRYVTGLFSFDLVTEQMTQISMSTSFLENEYERVTHIFEMDGCLSLNCQKNDEINHVWVFKGDGYTKSWVPLFSINSRDTNILGFTNAGMYLTHRSDQFELLNPRIEDFIDHTQMSSVYDGHIESSWNYFQSLAIFEIGKHNQNVNEIEEMET